MAYEIDFLAVGEGEKSGDAIALRFGNLNEPGTQKVLIVDGGYKDTGATLVEHIKTYYKTETVDAVLCTHSDSDHISGLTEVLDKMTVKNLFMHLPWKHAPDIETLFGDSKISSDKVKLALRKSLDTARELEALAKKKGIPITEPFSDSSNGTGTLCVLGPSVKFYESLLPNFRGPAELAPERPLQKVATAAKEVIVRVAENWGMETLTDPEEDATSAENNSSVVTLFTHGQDRFLFTADAGVPALTAAFNRATQLGIDLKTVSMVQIPHHGSKRNVGPTILDQILGPKRRDQQLTKKAYVSAAKDGEPKHPAKKVINAFIRRGAKAYATQGKGLCQHSSDAPNRGWTAAPELPFSNEVED